MYLSVAKEYFKITQQVVRSQSYNGSWTVLAFFTIWVKQKLHNNKVKIKAFGGC